MNVEGLDILGASVIVFAIGLGTAAWLEGKGAMKVLEATEPLIFLGFAAIVGVGAVAAELRKRRKQ